jgi:hypothetical protein
MAAVEVTWRTAPSISLVSEAPVEVAAQAEPSIGAAWNGVGHRPLPSRPASRAGGEHMAKSLKVGDRVSWNSSGGHSTGKIVKRQTRPTKIKGHTVAASAENPEYIVESEKSGKRAAHKPEALKKR